MLPFRVKVAIILLILTAFLTSCLVDLVPPDSTVPSIAIPVTPTRVLFTQTPVLQITPEYASPTATQNEPADFSSLADELISGVDWYILIQDAESGEVLFERNADTTFPPASMIKIPTALAVLSILEDQGRTLPELKTNGINGRNFDSLLEAMVVRSEESATDALEYFARGENQLRKKLDGWGLINTKYDPRTSTASELLTSLEILYTGKVLSQENTNYLLDLMGMKTENDQILLGKLTNKLPGCEFLNKRGTMLNPTIVSDMGILKCGEQNWYLVVAGTPAADSTATFEDIQASIEAFAITFSSLVR